LRPNRHLPPPPLCFFTLPVPLIMSRFSLPVFLPHIPSHSQCTSFLFQLDPSIPGPKRRNIIHPLFFPNPPHKLSCSLIHDPSLGSLCFYTTLFFSVIGRRHRVPNFSHYSRRPILDLDQLSRLNSVPPPFSGLPPVFIGLGLSGSTGPLPLPTSQEFWCRMLAYPSTPQQIGRRP